MGAISGAKAFYGLSSTGTPAGTNLTGSVTVGKPQSVIQLSDADICYSFTITSTGSSDSATLTISSGAVAQTTGTPTITDGDGEDFEGVTLPTLATSHIILVEPVGTTTGTLNVASSSPTNGIDKYIGIGSTYPLLCSFPSTGTIDFTFSASADSYKVTIIGETA